MPEDKNKNAENAPKKINILMGGGTSELQVSLMSGTNFWLKLNRSTTYEPQPFLLDKNNNIWKLPYHLCLNHTVEEIIYNCEQYQQARERLAEFEARARLHLGLLTPKNQKLFWRQ